MTIDNTMHLKEIVIGYYNKNIARFEIIVIISALRAHYRALNDSLLFKVSLTLEPSKH